MTSSQIIKIAKSQKGKNGTKFNKAYGTPKGTSWCCIFLWWVFTQCGASKLFYGGEKVAYVPYLDNWGKNNKLLVNKNNGKEGDIVVFDWGNDGTRDHVGFIIEKNSDGTYTTIEGNTSGGIVDIRKRSKSLIYHIIRPNYLIPAPKPKTSKKYNLTRLLVRGSKGEAVKTLQKSLKVKADGIFGPATEKAVKKYQKRKKLTADGKVGKNTAHKLGWLWCGK